VWNQIYDPTASNPNALLQMLSFPAFNPTLFLLSPGILPQSRAESCRQSGPTQSPFPHRPRTKQTETKKHKPLEDEHPSSNQSMGLLPSHLYHLPFLFLFPNSRVPLQLYIPWRDSDHLPDPSFPKEGQDRFLHSSGGVDGAWAGAWPASGFDGDGGWTRVSPLGKFGKFKCK
jgi:hypothetical protein